MSKDLDQFETSFGEPERPRPFRPNSVLTAEDDTAPMQVSRISVPPHAAQASKTADNRQSTAAARLAVVGLAFLVLFSIIGWRLVDLALTFGREDTAAPQNRIHSIAHTPGTRAQILDRNGELLAANLDVTSVFVDPRDVIDVPGTVAKLASVFPEKDPEWIRAQITSNSHFRWLHRSLSPTQEASVRRLGLPGVRFSQESQRFYPKGDLVSHILGYTGLDNQGLSGFEYSFDKLLQNSDQPVQLSLDIRAQHIVAEELQFAMDDFTAPAGAAVLMDANTSEIISMVSLPTFDPYQLEAADENQLFNRTSMGVYELGSIFKVFTVAMAMEHQGIKPTDLYNIGRPMKIGRWEIEDFSDYGEFLTVAEVLTNSSNKGSAQIALDVGANTQRSFLRRLGLLREASFELNQVGRPGYPTRWGQIHTATVSYGHGISVSPLQATNAFSAVVNGGVYREPTLIKSDSGYRRGNQVVRPEVSDDLNAMLRLVVTKGTGKNADAEGFQVGGKTGTADVQAGGGYDENRRIASFLGGFPINDPQYSLLVVVFDPQPNERSYGYATGGWVAAPAFKRMVERLGPVLGVAPEGVYPEIILDE